MDKPKVPEPKQPTQFQVLEDQLASVMAVRARQTELRKEEKANNTKEMTPAERNKRGAIREIAMVGITGSLAIVNPPAAVVAGAATLGLAVGNKGYSRIATNFLSGVVKASYLDDDSFLTKIYKRGEKDIPKPAKMALDGLEAIETEGGKLIVNAAKLIPNLPLIAQVKDYAFLLGGKAEQKLKDLKAAESKLEEERKKREEQAAKEIESFNSRIEMLSSSDPRMVLSADAKDLIRGDESLKPLHEVNLPFILNMQIAPGLIQNPKEQENFLNAFRDAMVASEELGKISKAFKEIPPNEIDTAYSYIIAYLYKQDDPNVIAIVDQKYKLKGILDAILKLPQSQQSLILKYLRYVFSGIRMGLDHNALATQIQRQVNKINEFLIPPEQEESDILTQAQQLQQVQVNPQPQQVPPTAPPAIDVDPNASKTQDPTQNSQQAPITAAPIQAQVNQPQPRKRPLNRFQPKLDIKTLTKLSDEQQSLVEKYARNMVVGNANTVIQGLNPRHGVADAMPEDVKAKFKEAGAGEYPYNPFLSLGKSTAPSKQELIAMQETLENSVNPESEKIEEGLKQIASISIEDQRSVRRYLSKLDNNQLKQLEDLAKIQSDIFDSSIDDLSIKGLPVSKGLRDQLQKVFNRLPQPGDAPEEEIDMYTRLFQLHARISGQEEVIPGIDSSNLDADLRVLDLIMDLTGQYILEDNLVFGSAPKDRSVLKFISAINAGSETVTEEKEIADTTNPGQIKKIYVTTFSTFEALINGLDGDFNRLGNITPDNYKQLSVEFANLIGNATSRKKSTINNLLEIYKDSGKLRKLESANLAHLEAISSGRILDLSNLDSSRFVMEYEKRDFLGIIYSLQLNLNELKQPDSSLGFDSELLSELIKALNISAPPYTPGQDTNRPLTLNDLKLTSFSQVIENLRALTEIYATAFEEIRRDPTFGLVDMSEDLREKLMFLYDQLEDLQSLGFSVGYSNRVNFNPKTFVMYMNGIDTRISGTRPRAINLNMVAGNAGNNPSSYQL